MDFVHAQIGAWRERQILETDAAAIADDVEREYLLFQQQHIRWYREAQQRWTALREELAIVEGLFRDGEIGWRAIGRARKALEPQIAAIETETRVWAEEAGARKLEIYRYRRGVNAGKVPAHE